MYECEKGESTVRVVATKRSHTQDKMTAAPTTEGTTPHDEPPTAAGLDVAETDDYLCSLLLPRFVSMWKHLEGDDGEGTSAHRLLWIQALLQGATLLATSGQTPATTALGLKAVDSYPINNLSHRSAVAKWITLSVILPTIYRQLRIWYESSTVPPSDAIAGLAHERRRQLVGSLLDSVGRTFPLMRLYALLSWWTGINHYSPQLSMTLAGISFVATRPPQRLFVSFAHRRWLYEELVRTIQMLAPFSSWTDVSSLFTW